MPIYCNDREVILPSDPKNDDPVQAFYRQHKDRIQSLQDYVVIKKYESESKFKYDDSGRPLRPTAQTVPFKAMFNGERGQETWNYGETRKKAKNDTYSYQPSHLIVTDETPLDPSKDIEKIFILTVVGNVGASGCFVFDPVTDAEIKARKIGGDELDVKFLIYKDPDFTTEQLILVAKAWGILEADKLNIAILRNKLFDLVSSNEKRKESTGRGYSNFITDVRNVRNESRRETVENKAVINIAVAKKVVLYDDKTSQWRYASNGDYICQVPRDKVERKNELLLEYYNRRSTELEALRNEVLGERIVPKYSQADIDRISTDAEARQVAKDLGISLHVNMKLDNAKKKLMESFQ